MKTSSHRTISVQVAYVCQGVSQCPDTSQHTPAYMGT